MYDDSLIYMYDRLHRTLRDAGSFLVALAITGIGLGMWALLAYLSDPHLSEPGTVQTAANREDSTRTFVGTGACVSCHDTQYRSWQGSHHSRAMLEADENSVLGDFNDRQFTYNGITSTFFRREGKFMVRTDNADGRLDDFVISYTFGVEPLQQYLIAFPDGRLQALSIAWDSRPLQEGGQRWFHLYPGERITHSDELHWTGLQQNWNFMCADCHSTNLRKNYNAPDDRFSTSWSEINVACEACHGPGSRHLAWADARGSLSTTETRTKGLSVTFGERTHWSIDSATGKPVRREAQVPNREIAVCAQCHSRRSQFSENYVAGAPLLDHYLPELLLPDLYYADGQQKDEVFSFGSFLQSKMYHAGVTCSHCHDPHSGLLRVPGNQVCGQCHASSTYDTEQHHFHAPASSGARCVSCHMPPTTYMVIDPRRDHSFRVPQPHLSVDLGVPNPCTGCHVDRPPEWAAEHVKTWYGRNPTGFQRFAYAFHADEHGHAGATAALTKIVEDVSHPATARASALQRLARRPRAALQEVARTGLGDRDPQVRRAALSLVENLPSEDRVRFAAVALNDPVRAVRVQAAWILAPTWRQLHPPAQFAFQRAAEEFVASQRYLADRPEGRSTLGTFFVYLGRFAEAEAEYRAAMLLLPSFVPAYINLADMFRSQQREAEAERILRDGLAAAPGTGVLHYSLGLTLARLRRTPEALQELERASVLTPEDARVVYTYAVALHSTGNAREAITTLEAALPRHPESREMLFALATFHRDLGNSVAASRYSERLLEVYPDDVQAQMLRRSLRPQ